MHEHSNTRTWPVADVTLPLRNHQTRMAAVYERKDIVAIEVAFWVKSRPDVAQSVRSGWIMEGAASFFKISWMSLVLRLVFLEP